LEEKSLGVSHLLGTLTLVRRWPLLFLRSVGLNQHGLDKNGLYYQAMYSVLSVLWFDKIFWITYNQWHVELCRIQKLIQFYIKYANFILICETFAAFYNIHKNVHRYMGKKYKYKDVTFYMQITRHTLIRYILFDLAAI
jgi:hypothetical protein